MSAVEFVSYDGKYPCACSGILTLRINGDIVEFPQYCLHSGGRVSFDKNWEPTVEKGPWTVDIPDGYEDYAKAITDCVNANVPQGCCGGCI